MSNWTRPRGLMLVLFLAGSAPTQAAPDDPQSPESLAKARVEIARRFYELAVERLPGDDVRGPSDQAVEQVALWSRRWMEGERDASSGKPIAAIESHRDRMKRWEDKFAELNDRTFQNTVDLFKFHRLEAELWLAKAKTER